MKSKIIKYIDNTVVMGISNLKQSMSHGVLIGIFVGFVISILDYVLTSNILFEVNKFHPFILIVLPLIGFLILGVLNIFFKIKNTSMADEIVQIYHHGDNGYRNTYFFKKIVLFFISFSSGLTVGLEGACKWIGGVIGLNYFRFFNKFKSLSDFHPNVINSMMSGAAAGISAIFKAPLSGTIMALESPFKKDFAHEPLVQSFIASVSSYTIFTILRGDSKFFILNISYQLKLQDILFSLILGIICGLISTTLIKIQRKVKVIFIVKDFLKYILGGLLMSTLAFFSFYFFKTQVALFSGGNLISDIFESKYSLSILLVIFLIRIVAYIFTFSFGGVGGQFVPTAVLGASIGFILQTALHLNEPQVFSLIGISSFITASYNGLLFGPILIAEITGEPNLVVLGIISSSISYLITNGVSNSNYQVIHRV